MAILSKNTPQQLQICTQIIFLNKLDAVTHLGQITNFDSFQGSLGVKWGSKRSKISQLAKINPQSKIFAQVDGYFFIIRRCSLFITYYNFLAFLGHSSDQFWVKKDPILLENNPKCSILAPVVVFKEKFNGVTNF